MTSHRTIFTAIACGTLASWGLVFAQPAPPAAEQDAAAAEVPGGPEAKPGPIDSDDGRCDACGSCVRVRKVCVPKPKEREITKVCWSSRCEDFCIPGPSAACGTKCQKDTCGWWWYDLWTPTWATIHTRKVPVKTVVTRKVPGFEWKPEERCAACRAGHADATCAAAATP
jgi:hypothetical protein